MEFSSGAVVLDVTIRHPPQEHVNQSWQRERSRDGNETCGRLEAGRAVLCPLLRHVVDGHEIVPRRLQDIGGVGSAPAR